MLVVHAYRRRDVDAVPRGIAEVERVTDLRVGRAEQEREQAVVARGLDDDADDPEPVAERAHALLEGRERAQRPLWHLHREAEVGRRLGPAAELLLRGQPVSGRVELHRRQALRIETEEVLGS